MYEITVKSDFKAAHELRLQGGKCESLHGHNWTVEVTLESEKLNEWGAVMDFHLLKSKLDEVLEPLDHARLNFIPPFDRENPTAERIARHIAERLSEASGIQGTARVRKVTVSETAGLRASYVF
jgi:6-pyruvoyltetrahydropterin/6-carboxytetrahydropterin synthase